MATRVKPDSKIGRRIAQAAKGRSLELGLGPGIGAAKSALTKGEKVMRRKLKSSIRERIGEVESSTRKRTKADRSNLRSDLRDLGKIEGDKKTAEFARRKRSDIFTPGTPVHRLLTRENAPPRARKR